MHKEIDIVGIGVSTLDILTIVDHFPVTEEVQKSIQRKIEGGGPIATALATASTLGAKTIMLDCLGDDWIGIDIQKGLEQCGVNTNYLKISRGSTSSFASILVRKKDGARTIIYSPGNSPELNGNDIPEELIRNAKYVHINGRHLKACARVCKIARETDTIISFDGGAHRNRDELKQIIPLVDLLIASKHFVFDYTKANEINIAVELLMRVGIKVIVITDGINGSWLFTSKQFGYHQGAFVNDEVVDTTGCGDSYHGAFLFSLCKGKDFEEAMLIASAVASLNTKKLGGREALLSYAELELFLNRSV